MILRDYACMLYIAGILPLVLWARFCFYFLWRPDACRSSYKLDVDCIVSNCCLEEGLECCVERAQQTRTREGKKALNLSFICRPQTRYIQYFDDGMYRSFVRALARNFPSFVQTLQAKNKLQMKLTSNVSRGAWPTRACSMEKQTVARSGFSLVWRTRNQLLAG